MALTAQQQARLNAANQNYSQALKAVSDQKSVCENTLQFLNINRQSTIDCQAKRDAKSTGIGKNQACHIDTLAKFNQQWSQSEFDYKQCTTRLTTLENELAESKKNLDAVTAAIKVEIDAAIKALGTDPVYAAEKAKQDAILAKQNEELAQKRTQTTLIFIIVVVSLSIGGFLLYRRFN